MQLVRTHASVLERFLLISVFLVFFLGASSAGFDQHGTLFPDSREKYELIPWRRLASEGPPSPGPALGNSSFVLAAERTHRKDTLNNYQPYTGGWNISDEHYWASVGFTAVPVFLVAITWLLGFGIILLCTCCCYCCCRRQTYSYSWTAYAVSLILLIIFTIAAVTGCVVLYNGQGKFHSSTTDTLDYIVSQASLTVNNLRNFSTNLEMAKRVGVDNVFLPSDIQNKIDLVEKKLNVSANELATRTSSNSKKIHDVFNMVETDLIILSIVMLVLAFLGFLFSILGMTFLVSVLVLIGWILVAGTFILSGMFLLFHNVVADACVAMDDWVLHPHARTALDDILPCVDAATANESLYRSREVTFQMVNIINQVINNISNANVPPAVGPPLYFNQSGPLMPTLCNPYASELSDKKCNPGEVTLSNAPDVWHKYLCKASPGSGGFQTCSTIGRVTPAIYGQMTAAVSITHGVYCYGPFLTNLVDCTFVRETFTYISLNNCPGLGKYSKWVYLGLAIVSTAVMLSLIFWVIYAHERRHRVYSKKFMLRSSQSPSQYRMGP